MAAKVKGAGITKNVAASKPVTTGTSAGKALQTQTAGGALQTIGNTVTQANDSFLGDIVGLINQGSQQANEYSAWAQQNQFAYNSAEAEAQRAYNTQMWEQNAKFNSAEAKANRDFQAEQQEIARAYNTAEAEKARQFNASEAEKARSFNKAEAQANRDWQERLDNTAYQRAVEDLKKAGLNPVLAALNGGAGVGSGATASSSSASGAAASSGSAGGSQASSGATSSGAASGSNFTGQGNNMSESLALVGAIGNLIGSGVSALGAYMAEKDNLIESTMNNTLQTIKRAATKGLDAKFERWSNNSRLYNNRQ